MVFNFKKLFTEIKNGQLAKKYFIFFNKTKKCEIYLKFFWKENLISGYFFINNFKIKIILKHYKKINNIKTFTKCKYFSIKQLWKINLNNFIIVIFTNKGLKNLFECKKENIGGKILAIIY